MEDYRVPVPDHVKETSRKLGKIIGNALPEGWGFCVLIFEFGEGGTMTYISNACREDVVDTMREFIQKQSS